MDGAPEEGRGGPARFWPLLPLLLSVWAMLGVTAPRRALEPANEGGPPGARGNRHLPRSSCRPRSTRGALAPPAPTGTGRAGRVAAQDDAPPRATPARASDPTEHDPDLASLSLLVRETGLGRVVSDARVELGHTPSGSDVEAIRVAATDATGRVDVTLEPGSLRVVAWKGGEIAGPAHLELAPGVRATHELELSLAFEVAGRVVDRASGLPIEGASVRLLDLRGARPGAHRERRHVPSPPLPHRRARGADPRRGPRLRTRRAVPSGSTRAGAGSCRPCATPARRAPAPARRGSSWPSRPSCASRAPSSTRPGPRSRPRASRPRASCRCSRPSPRWTPRGRRRTTRAPSRCAGCDPT